MTINTPQDVLKFLNHVMTCTKGVHLQNFDILGTNSCTIHALVLNTWASYLMLFPLAHMILIHLFQALMLKMIMSSCSGCLFACRNLMQIAHIINAHLKIAGDE